jgi:hypothetical protein
MRFDRWKLMGASLVGFGLFLAFPSRNTRGAPSAERLLDQCQLPSGAVVRLYHGEPHATVSDWYSLTYDPPGLGRERQIVFNEFASYATLRCDDRQVTMVAPDGVGRSTLTMREVEQMTSPERTAHTSG